MVNRKEFVEANKDLISGYTDYAQGRVIIPALAYDNLHILQYQDSGPYQGFAERVTRIMTTDLTNTEIRQENLELQKYYGVYVGASDEYLDDLQKDVDTSEDSTMLSPWAVGINSFFNDLPGAFEQLGSDTLKIIAIVGIAFLVLK